MAKDEYYPTVIEETPFPGDPEILSQETQQTSGGNFSSVQTNDKPLPRKRTAVELLSTALNTRSRNILQEFELQQSGAIKIGDFKEGLSGDIRLTPNGITARDIAGLTTFALDGTTGDAVFKGTLQAGTLIGGDGQVVIENIGDGGSITIGDIILMGYQKGGF